MEMRQQSRGRRVLLPVAAVAGAIAVVCDLIVGHLVAAGLMAVATAFCAGMWWRDRAT